MRPLPPACGVFPCGAADGPLPVGQLLVSWQIMRVNQSKPMQVAAGILFACDMLAMCVDVDKVCAGLSKVYLASCGLDVVVLKPG